MAWSSLVVALLFRVRGMAAKSSARILSGTSFRGRRIVASASDEPRQGPNRRPSAPSASPPDRPGACIGSPSRGPVSGGPLAAGLSKKGQRKAALVIVEHGID